MLLMLIEVRYQRAFIDFFEDQLVSSRYNLQELLDEYLFGGKEPLINCLVTGRKRTLPVKITWLTTQQSAIR